MIDFSPSVITSVVHDHAAPVAQYLGAIDSQRDKFSAARTVREIP